VNPANSSQACSGCGNMVPKSLSVRVHSCPNCGLVLNRDVNAARNILTLALASLELAQNPLGRSGQALTYPVGESVA
jgi:putative transposase